MIDTFVYKTTRTLLRGDWDLLPDSVSQQEKKGLMQFAARNQLVGEFARAVTRMPPPQRQKRPWLRQLRVFWQKEYESARARNLQLADEYLVMQELCDALCLDLALVPLKGVLLALLGYVSKASSDIDVYGPKDRVFDFSHALSYAGLKRYSSGFFDPIVAMATDNGRQSVFGNWRTGFVPNSAGQFHEEFFWHTTPVEYHWRLLLDTDGSPSEDWPFEKWLSYGSRRFPVFTGEATVVGHVLARGHHRIITPFDALTGGFLGELRFLMERFAPLDWESIAEMARSLLIYEVLWFCLREIDELYGAGYAAQLGQAGGSRSEAFEEHRPAACDLLLRFREYGVGGKSLVLRPEWLPPHGNGKGNGNGNVPEEYEALYGVLFGVGLGGLVRTTPTENKHVSYVPLTVRVFDRNGKGIPGLSLIAFRQMTLCRFVTDAAGEALIHRHPHCPSFWILGYCAVDGRIWQVPDTLVFRNDREVVLRGFQVRNYDVLFPYGFDKKDIELGLVSAGTPERFTYPSRQGNWGFRCRIVCKKGDAFQTAPEHFLQEDDGAWRLKTALPEVHEVLVLHKGMAVQSWTTAPVPPGERFSVDEVRRHTVLEGLPLHCVRGLRSRIERILFVELFGQTAMIQTNVPSVHEFVTTVFGPRQIIEGAAGLERCVAWLSVVENPRNIEVRSSLPGLPSEISSTRGTHLEVVISFITQLFESCPRSRGLVMRGAALRAHTGRAHVLLFPRHWPQAGLLWPLLCRQDAVLIASGYVCIRSEGSDASGSCFVVEPLHMATAFSSMQMPRELELRRGGLHTETRISGVLTQFVDLFESGADTPDVAAPLHSVLTFSGDPQEKGEQPQDVSGRLAILKTSAFPSADSESGKDLLQVLADSSVKILKAGLPEDGQNMDECHSVLKILQE